MIAVSAAQSELFKCGGYSVCAQTCSHALLRCQIVLLQVRLDKTSLPAPAVASLYLNGTGERMLPPERALYQAAVHLTWPRSLTDDDEYLYCQISELLLEDVERVGIDRNLPRCVCCYCQHVPYYAMLPACTLYAWRL